MFTCHIYHSSSQYHLAKHDETTLAVDYRVVGDDPNSLTMYSCSIFGDKTQSDRIFFMMMLENYVTVIKVNSDLDVTDYWKLIDTQVGY